MEIALEELSVEVSNECALMCIHCSSGSSPKKRKDELTKDEHFRIIKEAREIGATILSLSGGDPILVKDIADYVQFANDLEYERVLFYTTGIWQVDYDSIASLGGEVTGTMWGIDTSPNLESIIDAGEYMEGNVLSFIFSLHSHVPTINDYIMGITGCWHTITGGIAALRLDYNMDVEVHMVPMLPNYTHISKMRDLCAAMDVSKMSLLRFVPQTRGFSNKVRLGLGVDEFVQMQKLINIEVRKGDNHPVALRLGCPIDFRHTIGAAKDKPKPCHAGFDLILVRPNGSVHPCAAWKTLPDDDSVKDKSLMEIWESSKAFNALRDYHNGGYLKRRGVCVVCGYNDSCMGGCPAQRLHVYDKRSMNGLYISKPDPLCPIGNERTPNSPVVALPKQVKRRSKR